MERKQQLKMKKKNEVKSKIKLKTRSDSAGKSGSFHFRRSANELVPVVYGQNR